MDHVWTGAMQPIAQRDYITFGAVVVDNVYSVQSGTSVIEYVAVTGDVLDDIMDGLATVKDDVGREFVDIDFEVDSANSRIIATSAIPGTPYDLVQVTNTTVTSDRVASGPNFWASGNFNSLTLPVSTDRVIFQHSNIDLLYDIDQNALITMVVEIEMSFTGRIGLLKNNPNGYFEYRDRFLKLNATEVTVGRGIGSGSDRVFLDLDAQAAPVIRVYGTGSDNDETSSLVIQNATAMALTVEGGNVEISAYKPDTSSVASARVSGTSSVRCSSDVVVTDLYISDGAEFLTENLVGNTIQDGGIVTVFGSATTANVTLNGGQFIWDSTGDIGDLELNGDDALFSLGTVISSAVTIDSVAGKRGTFSDPNGRATITDVSGFRTVIFTQ